MRGTFPAKLGDSGLEKSPESISNLLLHPRTNAISPLQNSEVPFHVIRYPPTVTCHVMKLAWNGTEPPSVSHSVFLQRPILSSGRVCHTCAAFSNLGGNLARKTGQIIRRGSSTWLVRIYVGRYPEPRKRIYIGQSIQAGSRVAEAQLRRLFRARSVRRCGSGEREKNKRTGTVSISRHLSIRI